MMMSVMPPGMLFVFLLLAFGCGSTTSKRLLLLRARMLFCLRWISRRASATSWPTCSASSDVLRVLLVRSILWLRLQAFGTTPILIATAGVCLGILAGISVDLSYRLLEIVRLLQSRIRKIMCPIYAERWVELAISCMILIVLAPIMTDWKLDCLGLSWILPKHQWVS
jgi:hypothetical protein